MDNTFRRSRCAILVAAFFIVINQVSTGQDFSDDLRSTIIRIANAQKELQARYDNAHLQYEVIGAVNGQTEQFLEEFWSRDGKYFRIDSSSEKTIVRPEGFAVLSNSPSGASGAVTAFGSNDEGLDRIAGFTLFHATSRAFANVYVSDILDPAAKQEKGFTVTSSARNSGYLEIEIEWTHKDGKNTYNLVFDEANYSCVRSTTVIQSSGSPRVVYTASREIDPKSLLPRTIVGERVSSDGHTTSLSMTATTIERGPAAMSIFDLNGIDAGLQSKATSVWLRRTVVLAIGLTCIGGYFYLRRRTSHDNKQKS